MELVLMFFLVFGLLYGSWYLSQKTTESIRRDMERIKAGDQDAVSLLLDKVSNRFGDLAGIFLAVSMLAMLLGTLVAINFIVLPAIFVWLGDHMCTTGFTNGGLPIAGFCF